VVVLGATGSIGSQTIEVADSLGLEIVALAARSPSPKLAALAVAHPSARIVAAGGSSDERAAFEKMVDRPVEFDIDAVIDAARIPGAVVVNGIVGAAGLRATIAALETGNRVALANKESLVAGGPVVKQALHEHGGELIPVDSEHSALLQCLAGEDPESVARLVLTASGGPFRGRSRESLADVTPEEALAHPTWEMGRRITVDSATLFNKGLEVIEAHLLFDVPFDRIDVVVHPQSVVHSMVEFTDGSTLAQASPPDMRIPIALGLGWPDRVPGAAPACDWTRAATWEFLPLDDDAFPAVRLAREAGRRGGTAPAVYNAANEECVEAFLAGRLPFLGIVDTVETVLAEHLEDGFSGNIRGVDDVLSAEEWARQRAREVARRDVGS
jgi:1-deoxy-D-xylulose-5-phosphate reductoisomerase